MRNHKTMALLALIASALLALAVGTSSARRIEASSQRFRAVWSSLEFTFAGKIIRCPITLEGSFHSRTLSKVCGQLIGYISRAFVRETGCNGATLRALTETLPWHVQYLGFRGTLPSITGIRLIMVGGRFQLRTPEGFVCLFGMTQAHPFGAIAEVVGGVARTLRTDETAEIPLGGEFICSFAGEMHAAGTAEVFVQGSTTTRITVRLVQ